MHGIVFNVVEEVAGPDVSLDPQSCFFEIRIARQRRRRTVAEVDEDQAEILFGRATANADFFGEGFFFRRLLDALAGGIKAPTVKAAADRVVLDPADGKLRLAVRAAKVDQMRFAAVAAVERELLAHDLDRLGPAGRYILSAVHRVPKFSQVAAGKRVRTGVVEVHEVNHEWILRDSSEDEFHHEGTKDTKGSENKFLIFVLFVPSW